MLILFEILTILKNVSEMFSTFLSLQNLSDKVNTLCIKLIPPPLGKIFEYNSVCVGGGLVRDRHIKKKSDFSKDKAISFWPKEGGGET